MTVAWEKIAAKWLTNPSIHLCSCVWLGHAFTVVVGAAIEFLGIIKIPAAFLPAL